MADLSLSHNVKMMIIRAQHTVVKRKSHQRMELIWDILKNFYRHYVDGLKVNQKDWRGMVEWFQELSNSTAMNGWMKKMLMLMGFQSKGLSWSAPGSKSSRAPGSNVKEAGGGTWRQCASNRWPRSTHRDLTSCDSSDCFQCLLWSYIGHICNFLALPQPQACEN